MIDNNHQAFLFLLRAGLWGDVDAYFVLDDKLFGNVDWGAVYRLAEEQSVIGIVLAGIERYKNLNIDLHLDQEFLLQWIGEVQMLEQQNKAMNKFVAELIEKLQYQDVYAILVKGQGIAQCYERPFWRSCGDIDLLLSESNYEKAKAFLLPLAASVEEEDSVRKHLGLMIDGWVVELHGTMHTHQLPKLNKVVDCAQKDVFYGWNVRLWQNGNVQIFLPGVDDDVVLVFAHILQHLFGGGIGLRQICDWCRLLYSYKDKFDSQLLESRLREGGIMCEWKTFANLAVDWLGMSADTIPFFSNKRKWRIKGDRILKLILNTGNFGHGMDKSYKQKYPKTIADFISLYKYTKYCFLQLSVFPTKAVKGWICRILQGMKHI